jgi:hypothetical protein
VLDRPDPSDDRRMLAYDYRAGWELVIEPATDLT